MMLTKNTPHLFVTNTLAYLSGVSSTKENKRFIRLALVFKVIKHFSSSVIARRSILVGLSLFWFCLIYLLEYKLTTDMMLANNTTRLFATNTLAYLSGVSSTKEKKSFIRPTVVFNVIKHFLSSLIARRSILVASFLFGLV
jgi:hypothetical protein